MELQTRVKPRLAGPVAETLRRHHEGAAAPGACAGCSSTCCSHGGFAILENVLQIYELYRAGALRRADYQFAGGLGFVDFIFKYFDIVQWRDPAAPETMLALFHMKSLGPGGNVVAIPPLGPYPETREQFFEHNPWLNKGCIFLSEATPAWLADDGRAARGCILHDAQSATHLTAKPVDCVFFACEAPLRVKPVGSETQRQWLAALAEAYPGSIERFGELMIEASATAR